MAGRMKLLVVDVGNTSTAVGLWSDGRVARVAHCDGGFDEAAAQAQRDAQYRQKVLDSFFEYGKLKLIPAQRKKERIILEEIVKAFDFDRVYSERETNLIIADYYDDFCTLRRDMISEKLLDRDGKGYWRVKPQEE